ncbi:GNAT family N-acetyltransferase, partial [Streptomyces sp. NPDC059627]
AHPRARRTPERAPPRPHRPEYEEAGIPHRGMRRAL